MNLLIHKVSHLAPNKNVHISPHDHTHFSSLLHLQLITQFQRVVCRELKISLLVHSIPSSFH
ncbi:hypothetical protein C0J52_10187 [Blattella germanica]|nr:hypothetical protein C0J52_10187 [Blattella germanica]